MNETIKGHHGSNRVQYLFDELISEYDLRAVKIKGEMWYALNDLPLTKDGINRQLKSLNDEGYLNKNTKMITNSDVSSRHIRNFNTELNNRGEKFGNFKMINYLIMNSRMGSEYKIKLIDILDEIRKNDYYIDENISNENLDRLKKEVDRLRTQIINGNGGYEASQYKSLEKIANEWTKHKNIEITKEMLIELLKDKKWISKDEITKKAGYGNKIMCKNGIYFLSPQGHDLLLTHFNKINDDELLEWSKKYTGEISPF